MLSMAAAGIVALTASKIAMGIFAASALTLQSRRCPL